MQCDNPYAPQSSLFVVRETPGAGRGVFASADIPAGTVLLTAGDVSTLTIHREYRKEVCAFCFAYNRGINWPVRESEAGLSFCTEQCRARLIGLVGDDGLKSYQAIETLSKRKQKSTHEPELKAEQTPTKQEIEQAWAAASVQGDLIAASRTSSSPTKAARKTASLAVQNPAAPSVLSYLLSGVLTAASMPEQWSVEHPNVRSKLAEHVNRASISVLHANPTPYSNHDVLRQHIVSYLHLVAVLPSSLMPFATSKICYTLATRNSQNAFGLRSLDDNGDEIFGYGDWPKASYWNHSCAPNVNKSRTGREWLFRAERDILATEQLCITYLGGDERSMSTGERRTRLLGEWGFHCLCSRCVESN